MNTVRIVGNALYQWELGRKVQICPLPNMTVDVVHFSNVGDTEALVVKPKETDGVITAEIPNVLLQSGRCIAVYVVHVAEGYSDTLRECILSVNKRAKPSDYIYTETETLTWSAIDKRVTALEENQTSEEAIEKAVDAYFEQHPIEHPVGSVNGKTGDVQLTAEDVGAIAQDDFQAAVDEALAQAKASGEFDGADGSPGADGYTPQKGVDYFDGKDGKDGANGADGYTPVRGKDYWTDADQTAIVNAVLANFTDVSEVGA